CLASAHFRLPLRTTQEWGEGRGEVLPRLPFGVRCLPSARFHLPLRTTQEWGPLCAERIVLIGQLTRGGLGKPLGRGEVLPHLPFDVRRSMFDVRCFPSAHFRLPLRPTQEWGEVLPHLPFDVRRSMFDVRSFHIISPCLL